MRAVYVRDHGKGGNVRLSYRHDNYAVLFLGIKVETIVASFRKNLSGRLEKRLQEINQIFPGVRRGQII